jgi:hypothetical protein
MTYTPEELERMKRNLGVDKGMKKRVIKKVPIIEDKPEISMSWEEYTDFIKILQKTQGGYALQTEELEQRFGYRHEDGQYFVNLKQLALGLQGKLESLDPYELKKLQYYINKYKED